MKQVYYKIRRGSHSQADNTKVAKRVRARTSEGQAALPITDKIARYFYTVERTGTRTSYKCQTEPPVGTARIWTAAVLEDLEYLQAMS